MGQALHFCYLTVCGIWVKIQLHFEFEIIKCSYTSQEMKGQKNCNKCAWISGESVTLAKSSSIPGL